MLMPVEPALFNPLVCYLAAYLSFASTLQPSCQFHCQQYLPMASWHPAIAAHLNSLCSSLRKAMAILQWSSARSGCSHSSGGGGH